MDAKEVANVILQQLGGNKFIMMTGSKYFVHGYDNKTGNPFLSMRLSRNKCGAQFLKISLNALDLYDMRFTKTDRKYNLIVVGEYNDVYFDMLQDLFTQMTGLYTHL